MYSFNLYFECYILKFICQIFNQYVKLQLFLTRMYKITNSILMKLK